jgi:acetyl-CoA carboxylase carboxyl transferase subunit beta
MTENIFAKRKNKLNYLRRKRSPQSVQTDTSEQLISCPSCKDVKSSITLQHNKHVCIKCGYHFTLSAHGRLNLLFDNEHYTFLFEEIVGSNPIEFPDYSEKLKDLKKATGLVDACVAATGTIGGIKMVCAVLDSRFMMGSMGTAVGEKITRTIEYAGENSLPLVIFSASGGARMQEGIFSLMQMAKTVSALKDFSDSGGLYISYLTNPTTGGVTASFASLGDIILAEPGALIGFAGPRVIEQTIQAKLPEGFQRSEFLLEHGFIDAIIPRERMQESLIHLLDLHQYS